MAFLIRRNVFAYMIAWSLLSLVPWHRAITHYNLHFIKRSQVDIAYLTRLGESNTADLIAYLKTNGTSVDEAEKKAIVRKADHVKRRLAKQSWKEFNFDDQLLRKELRTGD